MLHVIEALKSSMNDIFFLTLQPQPDSTR